MRTLLLLLALSMAGAPLLRSQPLHYGGCWLRLEDGRYLNPKGFVVILEDGAGKLEYDTDDYQRMLRYGANVQVIRISIGPLSGIEGEPERQRYLQRIDTRVQLAKAAGIRTLFKMTVYGLKGFGGKWETIHRADGENRRHLLSAWEQIWRVYGNEPYVLGYDLLNEPFREQVSGSPRAYEDVVQNSLVPLYTELIKRMVVLCPKQWAIYQPLLVDITDRRNHPLPCLPIRMPRVHDRMIFAPHGYFESPARHQTAVARHQEEVKSSGAALMMGEWGRQTYALQDTSLSAQLEYTKLYIEVATIFDAAGMGLIKPWFNGTRATDKQGKGMTWSIFSDPSATGSAERKYIVDVICRPYPLVVAAAAVQQYGYDFTSRTFSMTLAKAGYGDGVSEIYIPEDRHYPDGFTVVCNDRAWLARDQARASGLRPLHPITGFDASAYSYDGKSQRLRITNWDFAGGGGTLKIIPGVKYSGQPGDASATSSIAR